ncbi:DUF4861 domain-containing protein [Bacteroides faecis]|jgi:galactose mutarotase-like protein|uniref:DUF4861 domain-containing protein n=1 Tax=Bacteroides faecis TaxID=674529 RepID=UPI001C3FDBA4|nr:DUF4861 domain-containing protein [Bacteroides faecis]MCS2574605.1 DUF4861 domain-containing protein [Bacteroides faecis]MCS3323885.1 DUF4861 domain-containing protein [Bacteroides faecis]
MKKIFILAAVALMGFASCAGSKQSMTVTVTNSLALERAGEMVEVPMSDVTAKLQLADTAQIVVLNEDGQQVPYQVTYDEKVVFPATVKANGTATYTIQSGTPEPYNVIACGRYYPERLDDVAWENDLGGYRAYGPALQKRGERGFGYDLFTKYNTTEPILESLYAEELDKEKRAKIAELKKTDPKAAAELQNAISYHIDHGYGMDCYAVGPTLGCGTAALMAGDTIIYPYCYRTQEILDNGPLRFTVKLEFNPLTVRGDSNVVEMRVITLDAGSYLNKTVVLYTNLKEAMPVTTGIVLREPDGVVTADAANGYITYVDPTTDRSGGNGKIFIGAAFPSLVKEAKTVLFPEKEKKELRGGADGHVLAISEYEPGSEYTYYWGSAWDKAAIKTVDAWNAYMAEYAQKVRTPLTVTY